MATAYFTDSIQTRYTIEYFHDDDCDSPIGDDDRLVTFAKYRRTGLVTDVSHDVKFEASLPRDRGETPFLVSVHDDWSATLRLYDGGSIDGVLYINNDGWEPTREVAALILAEYSRWGAGDCWGYRITDDRGVEIDACWGYIGREWAEEIGATELASLNRAALDAVKRHA